MTGGRKGIWLASEYWAAGLCWGCGVLCDPSWLASKPRSAGRALPFDKNPLALLSRPDATEIPEAVDGALLMFAGGGIAKDENDCGW